MCLPPILLSVRHLLECLSRVAWWGEGTKREKETERQREKEREREVAGGETEGTGTRRGSWPRWRCLSGC